MSTTRFAEDFRKHIMPRLEARMPDAALSELNEEQSYGDAFSALWWFSWFRGGSFLPDDVLFDLEEWIDQRLLAEIERLEPQVEQQIQEWQQSSPASHARNCHMPDNVSNFFDEPLLDEDGYPIPPPKRKPKPRRTATMLPGHVSMML